MLRLHSDEIAVRVYYENEFHVRAVFCHNKYRFFKVENYQYVLTDSVQRSENLTIQDWEEFKKKVKDQFDITVEDSHKPNYIK